MRFITIKGRKYRLIPFLIITGVLLFCFFLIIAAAGKNIMMKKMERVEKLEKIDIPAKTRALNEQLHPKNLELEKENENLKSTPYEFLNSNGDKEYYNLFTHKLIKTIKKDNSVIWSMKSNVDNILQYVNLGASVKNLKDVGFSFKDIFDNVCQNIEILKDAGYTIEDFKNIGLTFRDMYWIGFTLKELKDLGYTLKDFKYYEIPLSSVLKIKDHKYTIKDLKDAGYTIEDFKEVKKNVESIYNRFEYMSWCGNKKYISLVCQLKDNGSTSEDFMKFGISLKNLYDFNLFTIRELKDAGYTLKDFKDAEFSLKELYETDLFTLEELKDVGLVIEYFKDGAGYVIRWN
ncbi:hypothetical protein [Candidatus Phytoplasma fraxini]|uniref:Lipoprotein n=1 Tax=Ash yellows phytoplasma TaxID=35780 RepID=A0ABZ2UBB3_ASHYP